MSNFDYNVFADSFFYKHQKTHSPPCDAYSMHTHNMYEILYFVGGDATHIIEDRKYKLKKGDLVFIRPFKYHFIKIDSSADYERYDILFDKRTVGFDPEQILPAGTEVVNFGHNPIAHGVFGRIDYYKEKLSDEQFIGILPGLISEIVYGINIVLKDDRPSEFSVTSRLVSDALRIMNERLFTLGSISEVASELFVTESYLFRRFKEELHSTPKKYINDKRLLAAQVRLGLGEAPSAVYEKCGFRDYTSFYRSYVKYFGHSPSEENKGKRKLILKGEKTE